MFTSKQRWNSKTCNILSGRLSPGSQTGRRQANVECSQMSVIKTLLPVAIFSLLTIGCNSSSNNVVPDVLVDDSTPTDSALAGEFDTSSDNYTLRFTVEEDGVLDGLFSSPGADGQSLGPSADGDGGYAIVSLPSAGLVTVGSDGQVFQYEPAPDFSGMDTFAYTTAGGADVQVIVTITPMPDAPVLKNNMTLSADQGRLYSSVLEAVDVDGDVLTYSAENLPDWLGLDPLSGVLSGVPQQSDVGQLNNITLTVRDSTGLTDVIDDFELEVIDINDAPIMNITRAPTELFGGQLVSFNVYPDDIDNDNVSISVERDSLFEVTVDGGEITLQVNDINKAQSTTLTIVARDERGAVAREAIDVDLYPRTESAKGTTLLGYKEGRGIHLVILGDGYAEDEANAFRRHAEGLLDNIRSDEGIAGHLGAFNVHMIQTVSSQSGIDDSDRIDTVDTAFDSAYNCLSIPRLICADTLKVFESALTEYPGVDQVILLVNDLRFGGSGNSGGRIAITSAFYPEIALHEMGHSLADLADEYVDPLILATSALPPLEEGRYPNVSTLADPTAVPWAHWIDPSRPLPQFLDDEGVGIFEGGLYLSTGVFRPTANSRMRSFDMPFGPVNTEQWILRLYTLTDGIRNLSPRVQSLQVVADEPQRFSVEPIFGYEVQELKWTLNGQPLVLSGEELAPSIGGFPADPAMGLTSVLESADSAVSINGTSNETLSELALTFPPGQHQLTVTVSDTSGRIRLAPPHAGIFTWTWNLFAL